MNGGGQWGSQDSINPPRSEPIVAVSRDPADLRRTV